MTNYLKPGVGVGWRPETAWLIHENRDDLACTEVIAESIRRDRALPRALEQLIDAGMTVIPHGVSLSLGSAARPDTARLDHLAWVAERLGSPVVSEHVAFVRGGGHETDHLLPVPRTRAALDIVVANVQMAMDALPVPLVLENIAALFEWPENEIPEAEFLSELLERTGALMLLDLSNLYANSQNHGWEISSFLRKLPLSRLAYVHVAGGVVQNGLYHDTHAHPIAATSLDLLASLQTVMGDDSMPIPVILERDDGFGTRGALEAELQDIRETLCDTRIRGDLEIVTGEVKHVA